MSMWCRDVDDEATAAGYPKPYMNLVHFSHDDGNQNIMLHMHSVYFLWSTRVTITRRCGWRRAAASTATVSQSGKGCKKVSFVIWKKMQKALAWLFAASTCCDVAKCWVTGLCRWLTDVDCCCLLALSFDFVSFLLLVWLFFSFWERLWFQPSGKWDRRNNKMQWSGLHFGSTLEGDWVTVKQRTASPSQLGEWRGAGEKTSQGEVGRWSLDRIHVIVVVVVAVTCDACRFPADGRVDGDLLMSWSTASLSIFASRRLRGQTGGKLTCTHPSIGSIISFSCKRRVKHASCLLPFASCRHRRFQPNSHTPFMFDAKTDESVTKLAVYLRFVQAQCFQGERGEGVTASQRETDLCRWCTWLRRWMRGVQGSESCCSHHSIVFFLKHRRLAVCVQSGYGCRISKWDNKWHNSWWLLGNFLIHQWNGCRLPVSRELVNRRKQSVRTPFSDFILIRIIDRPLPGCSFACCSSSEIEFQSFISLKRWKIEIEIRILLGMKYEMVSGARVLPDSA